MILDKEPPSTKSFRALFFLSIVWLDVDFNA